MQYPKYIKPERMSSAELAQSVGTFFLPKEQGEVVAELAIRVKRLEKRESAYGPGTPFYDFVSNIGEEQVVKSIDEAIMQLAELTFFAHNNEKKPTFDSHSITVFLLSLRNALQGESETTGSFQDDPLSKY